MEEVIRFAIVLLLAACVLAGGVPFLLGGAQQQQPQRPADPSATIRVDVDLVNVLFTVKDRKGKLINTLEKDDFEVSEEGQRQQIRYFSRETALPLTIGLLIDTSVSMWRLVSAEQEAGEIFFRRVLGPKDLAYLISFDKEVELLQDFTANADLLRRGLQKLKANAPAPPQRVATPGPFPMPARGTLLYDAVYLGAREKLAGEVGRKTLVVISDGEDQGSRVKIEEAIEAAQKADVIIYGILFLDPEFYGYRYNGYMGDAAMKKMAEETGGRVIRVDRTRDLPGAFEEISQELRSQYSIGYVSSNTRDEPAFRRLRIKAARDGLRIQARRGYYKSGAAADAP